MGSVETLAHKGTGVVCQAVKKIVAECNGEPATQPCILEVSDQGLRMVDRSKPEVSGIIYVYTIYLPISSKLSLGNYRLWSWYNRFFIPGKCRVI